MELIIKRQHVNVTAKADTQTSRNPSICVWNLERDSISAHFSCQDWIIMARGLAHSTPSVYVFTSEEAALEFLEKAGFKFESLTWLQNPSERQA